jgi:hypothetical protein
MAIHYSNITLYGVSQFELLTYLPDLKFDAYISPTINEYTILYDVASIGYPQAIPKTIQLETNLKYLSRQYLDLQTTAMVCLSSHLSRRFNCSILAVFAINSLTLWYHLAQNGLMLDEYITMGDKNWQPGKALNSTNGSIKGGDAGKICQAFSKNDAIEKVEIILRQPVENFNSMTRHEALAIALGIRPCWVVGMNYLACTGADDFESNFESGHCEDIDPTYDEAISMVKGTLPKFEDRLL